ncbi:uncharacterized protein LOC121862248 [Homarus americanus]|nr:uncharacterized protein LOC121862248 [Homarus americanus]
MDEQDAHLVTCDAVVYASLAASTLDNTWYEDGETWRTEFKREELCSKSTHNFWLKQSCDYLECNKVCTGFGGHLLTVPSHLENLTTSVPLMCPTDETQVSWTSHDYQEDGPLTAKCPTLLLNGTSAFRFCLSELECSLCQAPMWLRFMLYGDIRGFDRAFFLKSQPGGNIYFEGLTTSIISIRGSSWVLSSRIHHRFWQLGHSSWPIGRRVWRSGTTNTTLTLTSCTVLQFSSDDGHCISREKRCNSLVDFPDRSDELGCLDRVVQKNNSYEHLVPPTHNNENETDVYYWFNVKNIREITTTNAIANIDMSVILYWSDPRLVMWDAGNKGISFFICDDIWHPKLGIRAGYENKGQEVNYEVYTSECAVIHSLSHHQYDMDDPYMGRFVYGEERNLTKLMQLLLALPCNFELHRYPFGQHQCNATFYLKIFEGDKELKTILESGEINYSGKKNLLDYKLLKVTFENTSSFATLTLHLQSQCDYHMLTSFAPSALMFIISYSSLFFPMAFFSDRIMVSLTALLVLAALFAQASDSYVKTPYYKLIDVWYATMICLCFTVVMTNVVTNCLQHMPQEFTYSLVSTRDGDGTKRGTPANSPRRAVYFNTVSKVLHIALFTSLVTVFIMFATDVI